MTEWMRIRQLAQFKVYLDPETGMAYSHPEYLPESVRTRLLPEYGFESHSQRAFFIITYDRLVEYKGLTVPYSSRIVPASGQPMGMLLSVHGEREAKALNDIASITKGVRGEYHDVGTAVMLRSREGGETVVRPSAGEKGGKIISYGVLKRWGDDYIPFIRLDLFETVRQLAILEGKSHTALLIQAMTRLGSILRAAHDIGIFHCFTHPGNIDAHGNLVDFEHAIYRSELPMLRERLPSEYRELLDEAHLRYRDIDFFFAGAREILRRCQVCFRLSRVELMDKIRFLRENIELTEGVPVLELLAHLNVGFYDDTLKKLPFEAQKEIIGAFIESYLSDKGNICETKRVIFSELQMHGEWTAEASACITDLANQKPLLQTPSELILGIWKTQNDRDCAPLSFRFSSS